MTASAASASWLHERRDRGADRVLDQAAHAQDVVLDLALLAVERLARRVRLGRGRRALGAASELVELVGQGFGRRRAPWSVMSFGSSGAQPNRPET